MYHVVLEYNSLWCSSRSSKAVGVQSPLLLHISCVKQLHPTECGCFSEARGSVSSGSTPSAKCISSSGPVSNAKFHRQTKASPIEFPELATSFQRIDVYLVKHHPPFHGCVCRLASVVHFTRLPQAILVPCPKSKAFVSKWARLFGCHAMITTERGSHFGSTFSNLLQNWTVNMLQQLPITKSYWLVRKISSAEEGSLSIRNQPSLEWSAAISSFIPLKRIQRWNVSGTEQTCVWLYYKPLRGAGGAIQTHAFHL